MSERQSPESKQVPRPRGFDDFDLRLGDVMRGERATLGKSLLDVQRELKVKAAYIAAIENGDASAFETPGFIAGYVRSYARYLRLDPEWAYSTFRREAGLDAPRSATADHAPRRGARPSEPAATGEGSDPFGAQRAPYIPGDRPLLSGVEPRALASIAVLAALIGVVGYGGWAVLQEVQKVQLVPVDQTPEVVTDLDPLSRAVAPPVEVAESGIEMPSADALDRLYRPKALDVPVMVARDGPIAALDPASVGTYASVAGERFAAANMPTGPEAAGSAETSDDPVALALSEAIALTPDVPLLTEPVEAPKVMLVAVRPSWVRVRAADGTVLFEKILDANEEYVLPDTEGVPTLRAGNAGSLYFSVNGETYGPAGRGPSVVKNVALSPEALTETYAVADPEADRDLARYYAEVRPPAQ